MLTYILGIFVGIPVKANTADSVITGVIPNDGEIAGEDIKDVENRGGLPQTGNKKNQNIFIVGVIVSLISIIMLIKNRNIKREN
ncbi:LPXTG cell wall anchor domain-containing protein [Bacillus thuringiensis]|uniref:LPXTG cell wall anchor domain-containing protein n=1 Tax=Bacillus thuringiensis TaxID=1428 RepID=UPI0015E17FD5|nr:LPXTG cell wall anchor domain-containing protein [Bacillus thuringiensis]